MGDYYIKEEHIPPQILFAPVFKNDPKYTDPVQIQNEIKKLVWYWFLKNGPNSQIITEINSNAGKLLAVELKVGNGRVYIEGSDLLEDLTGPTGGF